MASGNTTARGYGNNHQTLRRRWAPVVAAGGVICAKAAEGKCLHDDPVIDPTGPWDLGHNDDRTGYTGPEHVVCNRAAGGSRGAAVVSAARSMTVREW